MFKGSFNSAEDVAEEFGRGEYDYVNGVYQRIEGQYKQVLEDLEGATIHVAWYGTAPYEGKAFVLFEKDGTLYEVHASHCSCMGLEGQWGPEVTTWEALKRRIADDDYSVPSVDPYYDDEESAREALTRAVDAHFSTIN